MTTPRRSPDLPPVVAAIVDAHRQSEQIRSTVLGSGVAQAALAAHRANQVRLAEVIGPSTWALQETFKQQAALSTAVQAQMKGLFDVASGTIAQALRVQEQTRSALAAFSTPPSSSLLALAQEARVSVAFKTPLVDATIFTSLTKDLAFPVPRFTFPDLTPFLAAYKPIAEHVERWTRGLLTQWGDLADLGRRAAGCYGRAALRAAVDARLAVLQGRWEDVREFVIEWLGIGRPDRAHLEGAADALLESGWLPDDAGTLTDEVLSDLGVRALRYSRRHRLLAETQVGGRRIAVVDGDVLSALAVQEDLHDEVLFGFDDPRLPRLLDALRGDERAVVLARGHTDTWADAAFLAGLPANFGETVRRKVRRWIAEQDRRGLATA